MKVFSAAQVNELLTRLPTARDVPLFYQDNGDYKSFTSNKGILVNGQAMSDHPVAAPSQRYAIVQHAEAFRPVLQGLVDSGEQQFEFTHGATARKAWVNILVGEATDGVKFGFSISNSYDGNGALKYGFSGFSQKRFVEVVGYRLACANGMKMRVPLDEAEVISEETRVELVKLLEQCRSISHRGDAVQKAQMMKDAVKAVMLLKDPLNTIIQRAEVLELDAVRLQHIITNHIGERLVNRVTAKFYTENGRTLWDLYNALTNIATHATELTESTRRGILERSSVLLYEELFTPRIVTQV